MGCCTKARRWERWCNRPCVALVLTVILLMFLACAVATSWYFIWEENIPLNQTCDNETGDKVMYFTWAGLDISCQPKDSSSKTIVVDWSAFQSTTPKEVYVTTQIMLFLSMLFGFLLCLFLIFGFIAPQGSKVFLRRHLGGENWLKFIGIVLGSLSLIFVILAVGLFFRFPEALSETEYCPDSYLVGGEKKYWCHEFVGFETKIGPYKSSFTWYPALGWLFGVLGIGWIAAAIFIIAIIRPSNEDDTYFEAVPY